MSDFPKVTRLRNCGRCHECGEDLKAIEDCEEQWCPGCLESKRYRSHGALGVDDDAEWCPYVEVDYVNQAGKHVCRSVKVQDDVVLR
jgi:hypothetical protein